MMFSKQLVKTMIPASESVGRIPSSLLSPLLSFQSVRVQKEVLRKDSTRAKEINNSKNLKGQWDFDDLKKIAGDW
jgi:hypothetical protein